MLWRWMDARIKSGHDGDTLWARSRSGCTLFSDSIFKQPQTIRCRAVIPGWSAGPDPESRDSGFDASHRPGMTVSAPIPNMPTRPRGAMRPSCAFIFRPQGGRGECRVPVAPAASCALGSDGKHTSNNEYTGIARHSRTQWLYGLLRALPGDRALLPPSFAD